MPPPPPKINQTSVATFSVCAGLTRAISALCVTLELSPAEPCTARVEPGVGSGLSGLTVREDVGRSSAREARDNGSLSGPFGARGLKWKTAVVQHHLVFSMRNKGWKTETKKKTPTDCGSHHQ